MGGVAGLDLAPNLTGWCVGDGSAAPTAGAWVFPDFGSNLGAMLIRLENHLLALDEEYEPDLYVYEAPILLSHDSLLDLRRIYSLGGEVERFVMRRAEVTGRTIQCEEFSLRRIKAKMTGDHLAEKKLVAGAAEAIGIVLPRTKADGRLDAGDAAGAWALGLDDWNPQVGTIWDARLRQLRGALI